MFDSKTIPRVFKVPVGVDFSRVFLDGLKSRLHEKEPHELARVIVFINTRRAERKLKELFIESGSSLLPKPYITSKTLSKLGIRLEPTVLKYY